MRTTLIALVVVLLASAALAADRNKLPAQFVGDWCLNKSGNDKEPSTYRLGRCLNDSSDSWLTVRADGPRDALQRCPGCCGQEVKFPREVSV
jgi:hypothetical protein